MTSEARMCYNEDLFSVVGILPLAFIFIAVSLVFVSFFLSFVVSISLVSVSQDMLPVAVVSFASGAILGTYRLVRWQP